jgi:hypothetical protein
MKKFFLLLLILIALGGLYYWKQSSNISSNAGAGLPASATAPDPSSASFTIDQDTITLSKGSSTDADGNETTLLSERASGDLNADGKTDTALLLAQSGSGSGVFIYLAAYVSGTVTYKGTSAIFIGDRISPQSLSIKNGVITFTYLDRKPSEPFAAEPTVSTTKQFVFKNGELVEK